MSMSATYVLNFFFVCIMKNLHQWIFFWIDIGESIGGVSMFKIFIKVSLENKFYFQKRTRKLFFMKCCNILQDFICFKKTYYCCTDAPIWLKGDRLFFLFYWKCKNAQNLISKLLSLDEHYPISRPTNKRDT
jgi:hypothetical protein